MENYLKEIFIRNYKGIKGDIKTKLDCWMSKLDVQELIDYADEYGQEQFEKGLLTQKEGPDFTGSDNEDR
jgi:hypothetical protein